MARVHPGVNVGDEVNPVTARFSADGREVVRRRTAAEPRPRGRRARQECRRDAAEKQALVFFQLEKCPSLLSRRVSKVIRWPEDDDGDLDADEAAVDLACSPACNGTTGIAAIARIHRYRPDDAVLVPPGTAFRQLV